MTATNAGPDPVEVDPAEQFALLETFPPALQRVIWDAPIPLDLAQVAELRKTYTKTTPARLAHLLLSEYPDWHREWTGLVRKPLK